MHKHTQFCEEGYGYVLYSNKSQESTIQETVTYNKFEGLALVKPYKDQSYEVKVGPGESKVVVIR